MPMSLVRSFGKPVGESPFQREYIRPYASIRLPPERLVGKQLPGDRRRGYKLDSATVMVLRKKGNEMSVRVLNARGETLLDLKL